MKTLYERIDAKIDASLKEIRREAFRRRKDMGVSELNGEFCGLCGRILLYSSKDKVYKCKKCGTKYSPEKVLG